MASEATIESLAAEIAAHDELIAELIAATVRGTGNPRVFANSIFLQAKTRYDRTSPSAVKHHGQAALERIQNLVYEQVPPK